MRTPRGVGGGGENQQAIDLIRRNNIEQRDKRFWHCLLRTAQQQQRKQHSDSRGFLQETACREVTCCPAH